MSMNTSRGVGDGKYPTLGALETNADKAIREGDLLFIASTGQSYQATTDVTASVILNTSPQLYANLRSGGGSGSETPASIKTKYESNANTNAFTDAEKSKLSGVGEGANIVDIIQGSGVTIDKTDPKNPIINATGGGGGGPTDWGSIGGTLENQTDLQNALDNKEYTVSSSDFTYDSSGVLTEMTEVTEKGNRVTTFTYVGNNLTQSVEVLGGVTKTTTYTYTGDNLTGVTTV